MNSPEFDIAAEIAKATQAYKLRAEFQRLAALPLTDGPHCPSCGENCQAVGRDERCEKCRTEPEPLPVSLFEYLGR